MQQIVESCRICGDAAYNLKSLYEYKKITRDELECEKYLPAVIRSISGVQFQAIDEPWAVICSACTEAILKAEVIIEKCQQSYGRRQGQEGVRSLAKQGNEADRPNKLTHAAVLETAMHSSAEAISQAKDQPVNLQQTADHAFECKSDIEGHAIPIKDNDLRILGVGAAGGPTEYYFANHETRDTSTDSDAPNLEIDLNVPNIQLERPQAQSEVPQSATQVEWLTVNAENTAATCLEQPISTSGKHVDAKDSPTIAALANNVKAKHSSAVPISTTHKKFHIKKRNYVRKVNKNKDYFFACEQCDYSTPFASYYRTHLRDKHDVAHPRIFKCQLCPKDFIEYRYLQQHIRSDHQHLPKQRKYLCAECGRHFAKASNLQYHQTTHLPKSERAPVPTVSCRYCEGVYSIHSIRVHILSMHATDRSHFCTECQAAFALARSLQAHMRTCHPSFVLRCPCCEVKFRVKSVYEAHVQRGDCQKLGFNCEYCAWGFKTKERLEKHYTTVHKNLRQLSGAMATEAS